MPEKLWKQFECILFFGKLKKKYIFCKHSKFVLYTNSKSLQLLVL